MSTRRTLSARQPSMPSTSPWRWPERRGASGSTVSRGGSIAAMPTIRANGLDIGYDEAGSGPVLLLLHGAATPGWQTYDALLPRLTSSFRVLLPDARGHGRTRWNVADGFEAGWLVDDALAFVDALGVTTFHLGGYSMGGMTAL